MIVYFFDEIVFVLLLLVEGKTNEFRLTASCGSSIASSSSTS